MKGIKRFREGFSRVSRLFWEERGDFVQNAIYLALVVIFGIGIMKTFGEEIQVQFQNIISKLQGM